MRTSFLTLAVRRSLSASILGASFILAMAGPAGAQTDGEEAPAAAEAPAEKPAAVDLSIDAVNQATFDGTPIPEGPSALVLKLQVLLDRAGYSPGVIDGVLGSNVAKGVIAAEAASGLPQDAVLDADLWTVLTSGQETPVLGVYTITAEDLAYPFNPNLPSDYAELAQLDSSAYRTPLEMFGERFHMDEDLLKTLNPNAHFSAPGTQIVVAIPGEPKAGPEVSYIIADKSRKQVLAYDAENRLVVSYPATIGSEQLPSPSGTHYVEAVAPEAAYYYRPDVNFQQGDNTEPLTIPPGPNNPVGTTWIDLTEPTYGIHGTPEPARIDKTNSHGCIRLTNWDAQELAALVKKGVPVEFR